MPSDTVRRASALGSAFQVNTYTTNTQADPVVAMDAAGDFVVAWQSYGQDGSSYGIYSQRYNASGAAQGSEFRVNTYTTSQQSHPSAAMDSAGDFVIAWESLGQDAGSYGVYAQLLQRHKRHAPGSEFKVNTYTTGGQSLPSVAMDTAGDFVVAWTSLGQDGASGGIYAQRYNASGAAQGAEFQVNTYTTGNQTNPSVAMDSEGDFVVAWESYGEDGSGYGIYAQRYNAAGVAQGGEFQVNTYTKALQGLPAVAMDAAGDFVVAWESYNEDGSNQGIYAQQYSSTGAAQGNEFRVNTYTTAQQSSPAVAMDSAGDFVVTWDSYGEDGSLYGIYAQRYAAPKPSTVGAEFRVNTYTTDNQDLPKVAMDAAGDFVVTWESYGQDGSGYGIYAQRYNAAGLTQGSEFQVNTYTTGNQKNPSVAMDSTGDIVIAWQSFGQDGNEYGTYAQRYNSAGVPQGSEFLVNTYTTGGQSNASVAMDAAGDFVVAWQSFGQDGSLEGIFARSVTTRAAWPRERVPGPTYTTGDQFDPAVAMDASGDFVIAWQSIGEDGSDEGVFAQRYNSTGAAQGVEFQVNTYTTGNQDAPTVAMDSAGDFVVAWESYAEDGSGYGVYAPRYNSSGVAQGSEFRVNTYTSSDQGQCLRWPWIRSAILSSPGRAMVRTVAPTVSTPSNTIRAA